MKNHKVTFWLRNLFLSSVIVLVFFYGFRSLLDLKVFSSADSNIEEPYLNVYNWYGMINADILKQFENETGITVRYDLYDNNEIVEAKLFSGNSGYDIIFPSASPYVARQIEAGVYQQLNKSLLPNLDHIDLGIWEQMRIVDPDLSYSLPYFWGTFGFSYVEEEILKRFPDAPVNSYRMLFDPSVVSKFKDCGVTLLDEAVDVYPTIMAYLGINPCSDSMGELNIAHEKLTKIRPFIRRFSSSRFVGELVGGESCVAQSWSGEAQLAQLQAKEVGKSINIRYVVPEEGGTMWIDAIAIPKDAPHPLNAHKFINFLFRPEIAATIANDVQIAIANITALPFIDPKIRNDLTIFPSPATMKKLKLDKPQALDYERHRTLLWTQFRIGKG